MTKIITKLPFPDGTSLFSRARGQFRSDGIEIEENTDQGVVYIAPRVASTGLYDLADTALPRDPAYLKKVAFALYPDVWTVLEELADTLSGLDNPEFDTLIAKAQQELKP